MFTPETDYLGLLLVLPSLTSQLWRDGLQLDGAAEADINVPRASASLESRRWATSREASCCRSGFGIILVRLDQHLGVAATNSLPFHAMLGSNFEIENANCLILPGGLRRWAMEA